MNPPLHPELRVRARSVRIKARYVAPLFRWKIMIHIHHTTIADGAPLHGAWVRSPDGWRDVYLYIRKDEDLGNLHEYLPLGMTRELRPRCTLVVEAWLCFTNTCLPVLLICIR